LGVNCPEWRLRSPVGLEVVQFVVNGLSQPRFLGEFVFLLKNYVTFAGFGASYMYSSW